MPRETLVGLLVDDREMLPLDFALESGKQAAQLRKSADVSEDEYMLTRYLRPLNHRQSLSLVPPPDWKEHLLAIGEQERVGAFALAVGFYSGTVVGDMIPKNVQDAKHISEHLRTQLLDVAKLWQPE